MAVAAAAAATATASVGGGRGVREMRGVRGERKARPWRDRVCGSAWPREEPPSRDETDGSLQIWLTDRLQRTRAVASGDASVVMSERCLSALSCGIQISNDRSTAYEWTPSALALSSMSDPLVTSSAGQWHLLSREDMANLAEAMRSDASIREVIARQLNCAASIRRPQTQVGPKSQVVSGRSGIVRSRGDPIGDTRGPAFLPAPLMASLPGGTTSLPSLPMTAQMPMGMTVQLSGPSQTPYAATGDRMPLAVNMAVAEGVFQQTERRVADARLASPDDRSHSRPFTRIVSETVEEVSQWAVRPENGIPLLIGIFVFAIVFHQSARRNQSSPAAADSSSYAAVPLRSPAEI